MLPFPPLKVVLSHWNILEQGLTYIYSNTSAVIPLPNAIYV